MSEKLCKTCGSIRPLEDFAKCSRRLHGLHYRCKKCENELRKSKRLASIDSYRACERIRTKRRAKANRESVNKERRKAWASRSARDPSFVLNNRMRRSINDFLSRGKGGRSWRGLVGYGLEELKVHLERQFVRGMSWENIGEWHVDHIVPLSEFKGATPNSDSFRAAWSMANLRPLWRQDNVRKSNNRTFLI